VSVPTIPFTLDGFLPPPYEGYQPVVEQALTLFVSRLGMTRQLELVSAVADCDSMALRLLAVARCCPTLHKLGQVVARDHRLSIEFRQRLQELESLPVVASKAQLIRWIEAQPLGPKRFSLIGKPIAEGSVAVVVPIRVGGRTGVAKILKPEVRARLEEELEIWPEVAQQAEAACRELGLATPDLGGVLAEVGDQLRGELRLDLEQQHLVRAAESFAGDQRVIIPELLAPCTDELTLMTRVVGRPLVGRGQRRVRYRKGERQELARLLVEALIARPLFEADGPTLFHADPHAGNLLRTREGQIALLDWSLAAELLKEDRVQLVKIIVAGLTLDRRALRRAIGKLAVEIEDRSALRLAVDQAMAEVRGGRPPGLSWLVHLIDRLVTAEGGRAIAVRFPSRLLFLRKSLVSLEGVLADLDGGSWDRVLVAAALRKAISDLPKRRRSGPFSRSFSTHLSNAELLSLLGSGPATAARFFWQSWEAWARGTGEVSAGELSPEAPSGAGSEATDETGGRNEGSG
jgi:ubiquinone biosynthesis protein